jgi:hypothetical protein
MNTTSKNTRTASIAAVWADVRHAQLRMIELNRPWAAKHTSR